MKKSGFVQYKHIKVTDTPVPVGYTENNTGFDFNEPENEDYQLDIHTDDEPDEEDNIDYTSCTSEPPSDVEEEKKRPRIRSADRKKKFPDELTEETDFKILSPPTINNHAR